MATILVLQHGSVQGTGRLGATLRDHGFRLDIRRLDRSAGPDDAERANRLPPDLDGIHGIVSLGGPQNVGPDAEGSGERHWWVEPELALLRAAHESELPVVGSCLGLHLIALALGGSVSKLAEPEIGFCEMSLTVPGQTETIVAGTPWAMPHFFSHGYAVTEAPTGAAVLATTEKSPVAAMRVGLRTFGFQHHFEADRPMAEAIAEEASGLMRDAGLTRDAFREQLDARYDRFAVAADRLCVNLATFAFPFSELLAS